VTPFRVGKSRKKRASLNLLQAMHFALTGQKWDQLPERQMAGLTAAVEDG